MAAHDSEYPDHLIVGRIELFFFLNQNPGEKEQYEGRSHQTAHARKNESDDKPEARKPRQQVTGAAEPCEECGQSSEIEWPELAGARRRMAMRVGAEFEMDVGQMQMRACEHGEQAQNKPEREADQVEIGPGHG